MKTIKVLGLGALLLAMLAPLIAQQQPEPPKPGKLCCAKDLNLTSDQQALLSELQTKTAAARKSIEENTSLSDAEKSAQWKALSDNYEASFRSILTTDQLKKLDAGEAKCPRKSAHFLEMPGAGRSFAGARPDGLGAVTKLGAVGPRRRQARKDR